MATKTSALLILGLSLLLAASLLAQQQQPGDIPDAPSATRPIPPPPPPSPRDQANQPESTPRCGRQWSHDWLAATTSLRFRSAGIELPAKSKSRDGTDASAANASCENRAGGQRPKG